MQKHQNLSWLILRSAKFKMGPTFFFFSCIGGGGEDNVYFLRHGARYCYYCCCLFISGLLLLPASREQLMVALAGSWLHVFCFSSLPLSFSLYISAAVLQGPSMKMVVSGFWILDRPSTNHIHMLSSGPYSWSSPIGRITSNEWLMMSAPFSWCIWDH